MYNRSNMKEENLEILKSDYKMFFEHFCYAHSAMEYLIKTTNRFLSNHKENYDYIYAENLDLYLLYFEKFYNILDNMMEEVENLSFAEHRTIFSSNITNIYDYVKIPDNYEQDILVDMNTTFDWNL